MRQGGHDCDGAIFDLDDLEILDGCLKINVSVFHVGDVH